jgi:hypothetical protein
MTTSGGIAALTGYDVQSTVILELILTTFEEISVPILIRPEGRDDLDISWIDPAGPLERKRFYQIKKATEGDPSAEWSLASVARDLLGDAVRKLANNDAEQYWILGDKLSVDVQALLDAGHDAPEKERDKYLVALHRLAKAESRVTLDIDGPAKHQLDRWTPTAQPGSVSDDINRMVASFSALVADSASPERLEAYRVRVTALATHLPKVIPRIRARSYFGTEAQIADRVKKRLVTQYRFDPDTVHSAIFRNLRGFINDVSKEPGRNITREEFEQELVEVWPRLVTTGQPLSLEADHINRPELVAALVEPALAVDIIGPSGAGKSRLASEVFDHLSQIPALVVLFAEVRSSNSLRDVLVGVAYSLHRRRVSQLIGSALNVRATDTATIEAVADVLSGLSRQVLLILDMADGEASPELRRDLASFTRALRGSKFTLLAFSQSSVFRDLSDLERQSLGVQLRTMPGLNWGEFLSMVTRRHPQIERSALYDIFERLTSGLPSGLLPSLASQLARSKSLDEMEQVTNQPPEQRLVAAHRTRFYSLPLSVQDAAYRIVCLSLPLPALDLAELFPNDPIGAALALLAQEGLMPSYDDRVEMHDTVRSGLERLVPPAIAKDTHAILAAYFERRGMSAARIHHLDRAGRGQEAQHLARELFLSGTDWPDIADYLRTKRCVEAEEVTERLLNGQHHDAYLLPDILQSVKAPDTGEKLLEALSNNRARYQGEYQWAWRVQEALLKCDPSKLSALASLALEISDQNGNRVIDSVLTAARRAEIDADDDFMRWFQTLPVSSKEKVVGLLLLKPEPARLAKAFEVVKQRNIDIRARSNYAVAFNSPIMDLKTSGDIDAVLAAIPAAEPGQMFVARSALLDPFGGLVWHERNILRIRCRQILKEGLAVEPVLLNATRVLIYLNDLEVVPLTRSLRNGDGALASVAWFAPAILNAREELPYVEAVALGPPSQGAQRSIAILIASELGADAGLLLRKAIAAYPDEKKGLEFMLMMQAAMSPVSEVVPLLKDALEAGDVKLHDVLGVALVRTAETSFSGVDELLVSALQSPSSALVATALMALRQRRLRTALEPIVALVTKSPRLGPLAIPAAMASGPRSMKPFEEIWSAAADVAHWRWILAGRLRDAGEAAALVRVATDLGESWKARRLAILAAGRLPFESALQAIASTVLATQSSLVDQSPHFYGHSILSNIIAAGGPADILSRYRRGRQGFIEAMGPLFDEFSADLLDRSGVAEGREVAGWLWDRLDELGFESNLAALDRVENDLHIPLLQAALLRGLRLQERYGDLVSAFEHSINGWIRVRAMSEICRGKPLASEHQRRLEECLKTIEEGRLKAILLDVYAKRPLVAGLKVEKAESTARPASLEMTAGKVREFMRSSDRVDPRPMMLTVSEQELRDLVRELDPQLDTRWIPRNDAKPARVALSETGWRLRGGPALESSSPHYEQRAALRPALAAANRFGVDIPWHRAQLMGEFRATYADRFFASLAAFDDRDRFLVELNVNEDLIVPLFDQPGRTQVLSRLVDERVLPILARHLASGPASLFQGLCTLVCHVDTSEVDPVLGAVFRRWLVLLDQLQSRDDRFNHNRPEWRAVWQTLSLLRRHPRVMFIPQVVPRLLQVLGRYQLHWVHKQDIMTTLERAPAAYLQFEQAVIHSSVFEHYFNDEVDRYDGVADALFGLAS